jgi:hypothetical protein
MTVKYTANHAICNKFKKYLNMTAQYIYITSTQCFVHISCMFGCHYTDSSFIILYPRRQ